MGPLVVCICNKLRSREKVTLKNTSYLSTTHYCNGSTTFSINNNMNSLFLSFNGYNVQSVFYLASIQDLTSPHKRTEAAPLQLTCYLCEYIYINKRISTIPNIHGVIDECLTSGSDGESLLQYRTCRFLGSDASL